MSRWLPRLLQLPQLPPRLLSLPRSLPPSLSQLPLRAAPNLSLSWSAQDSLGSKQQVVMHHSQMQPPSLEFSSQMSPSSTVKKRRSTPSKRKTTQPDSHLTSFRVRPTTTIQWLESRQLATTSSIQWPRSIRVCRVDTSHLLLVECQVVSTHRFLPLMVTL